MSERVGVRGLLGMAGLTTEHQTVLVHPSLTPLLHETYKRLGGAKWLRAMLTDALLEEMSPERRAEVDRKKALYACWVERGLNHAMAMDMLEKNAWQVPSGVDVRPSLEKFWPDMLQRLELMDHGLRGRSIEFAAMTDLEPMAKASIEQLRSDGNRRAAGLLGTPPAPSRPSAAPAAAPPRAAYTHYPDEILYGPVRPDNMSPEQTALRLRWVQDKERDAHLAEFGNLDDWEAPAGYEGSAP